MTFEGVPAEWSPGARPGRNDPCPCWEWEEVEEVSRNGDVTPGRVETSGGT